MCNLYSITTNQAAIIALFRVINRYVDNLPPMRAAVQAAPSSATPNTLSCAGAAACASPAPSTAASGAPAKIHFLTSNMRLPSSCWCPSQTVAGFPVANSVFAAAGNFQLQRGRKLVPPGTPARRSVNTL